jgi:hypothetical protein
LLFSVKSNNNKLPSNIGRTYCLDITGQQITKKERLMQKKSKSILVFLVLIISIIGFVAVTYGSMNVFLKNGRVITVPVHKNDIIGISFEGAASPGAMTAIPSVPDAPTLPVQDGLVMWLDANDLESIFQTTRGVDAITADNQPAGLWRDKSGNENHFIQHRPEARPRYGKNALGGKPALIFDAGLSMSVGNNFPAPVTVIYVVQQSEGPNRRVLQGVGNNWLLGYWNGAKHQAYYEGWVSPSGGPPTDHEPHIFTSIIPGKGQNSEVWADGLRIAANQNGVTGPNGLAVNGGAYPGESSNCQVAEIIVLNRVISRPERELLEKYLRNKWLRN